MSALQPNKAAAGTKTTATPAPEPQAEIQNPAAVADFFDSITKIELETVIGGALQRITFGPGTDPTSILPGLKALDPTAQVRTEFYSGKGGKRDNKTATLKAMNIRVTDTGAFIDISAYDPEGTKIAIVVSKKKAPTFLADLTALGKLSDETLAEIQALYDNKKGDIIILDKAERIGVAYWTTDDGKNFLESFSPEPPAPAKPAEPKKED